MTLDPTAIVFALLGSARGFGADAIAHRWPAHDDEYVARRPVDWRSAVVVVIGALAFGSLGAQYADDASALVVYVPTFAALLLLLATDLDQRVLPDLLTVPLIAFAWVVLLVGASPALAGKDLALVSGISAAVALPLLLLVLDRVVGGELGFGDVKLSIGLGLMFGVSALLYGLIVASVLFAV